jgi:hypothetical protein
MHESDDKELDALLQRRSDLATHYRRAPTDEPSPQLDAVIRAAARRAIESQHYRRQRWVMPAAAAALLVLGVSVAVLVRDVQPPVRPAAERGQIAYRDEVDRPASQIGASVAQKPAAVPPRAGAKAVKRDVSTRVDAPQSDQVVSLQDRKSRLGTVESSGLKEIAALPQVSSPASPQASSQASSQALPQASLPAVPPAESRAEEKSAEPASAQVEAAKDTEKKSDVTLRKSKAVPSVDESPAKQANQTRDTQALAPETKAETTSPSNAASTSAPRSAEEWLKDIAALTQQGKVAEAELSLKEFRRRYPTYPITTPKP